MSARQTFADPLHASTDVGKSMDTATETEIPAGSPMRKTSCGSCGRSLFGEVAYCPYCGRPSVGTQTRVTGNARPETHGDAVARVDAGGPAPEQVVPAGDGLASVSQSTVSPAPEAPGSAGAAAGRDAKQALADHVHADAAKLRALVALGGTDWKARWKPILGGAAALAVVFAVGGVKFTTGARTGAQPLERTSAPARAQAPATATGTATAATGTATGAANPSPAPRTAASARTAQTPVAEPVLLRAEPKPPQQQVSAAIGSSAPATVVAPIAPTAPRRALCSAASEAAGLCNPQ